MPNVGTVVRLRDGRGAAISRVSPRGDDAAVFPDGHEERVGARGIAELLTDEDRTNPEPLRALRSYLARGSR